MSSRLYTNSVAFIKNEFSARILILCFFTALSNAVCANEGKSDTLLWVGSALINYKKLEFQHLNLQNNQKFEAKPHFPTLKLSLTAAYNAFYLSGNYDFTLKDYEDDNSRFDINNKENYRYSRTDANITLGYSLYKSFSLFGGYLMGETEIEYDFFDNSGNSLLKRTDYLTENGLFVGFHFSVPVMDKGIFSANVAYALLEGEYEYNISESPTGTQKGAIPGDTNGVSYGLKYTHTIFESIYIVTSFKINKYRFEADSGIFSTDENFSIFSIGISKMF